MRGAPRRLSAFTFAGPSLSTTVATISAPKPPTSDGLVHDQQLPGLLHRVEHHLLIPRPDRAQVDQVHLRTVGGPPLQRLSWRPAIAADHEDDRRGVPSVTLRATPNGIGSIGSEISPGTPNRSFGSRTAPDRRCEWPAPAGPRYRPRSRAPPTTTPADAQTTLPASASAARPNCATCHAASAPRRRACLSSEHVADLGDLVDQFVHRAHHEVEDAHLDDRPHPDQRRAETRAHDGRLPRSAWRRRAPRRTRRGSPCTGPHRPPRATSSPSTHTPRIAPHFLQRSATRRPRSA